MPGLTPTQVRAQLARMGWTGALPIHAHDRGHASRGKAPGIARWQVRARYEGDETTAADLKAWERKERQWPGTGLACGNVVTIDADFATDAALADTVTTLAVDVFGETPFVRQGQAPKVALVYRAAEAMPSISLKTADGSGDGIDILAEARQVVAYGVHWKTLKPYAWIGTESPLTAGPDIAPEITAAQVAAFLGRLRGIVELNGTGGRAGRAAGTGGGAGGGEVVRGPDGRVTDGREFHLTRTVYATACAMKAEGVEITTASLAAAAWEAFAASTVLDDGRWSPEAARVKAHALLGKVRCGQTALGTESATAEEPRASVAPTYPDRRASLAEAEVTVSATVSEFFEAHVPAWRASRAAWKAAVAEAKTAGREAPEEPLPVSWGARVETAIGKTALAIRAAATAAKAGASIVYAIPTHRLADEIAGRFAAEGVEVRVYRGFTVPDPEAPGLTMCLDLPAFQDARDALRSVRQSVCEYRHKPSGHTLLCALHDRCGMQRQRNASALVWLVPHALLFHQKPEAIPSPDALVIDEGVTKAALSDKPVRLSLDEIERTPIAPAGGLDPFSAAANDLEAARGTLLRTLRDQRDDGPLQRRFLIAHGLTAAMAGAAHALEWARMHDPGILPGMDPEIRRTCARAAGAHNAVVVALAGVWAELRDFLSGDAEASGRLALGYDAKDKARVLERRSLGTVRAEWSAPALLLDATLTEAPLLEPILGHPVEIRADVSARWSPYVTVRQITGAPVTARKLGLARKKRGDGEEGEPQETEANRRVVRDLLRLIRLRAALAWPRVVVVVGAADLERKLGEAGLPPNVETGHFGAVAGIDRWRDAAGLICIGQMQPGPQAMETLAGIVTGRMPETLPAGAFKGTWYGRTEGGIRLGDGTAVRVEHARHPDATVEALRWQITEGELIQAVGRLRALRRGPEAPAFLDIIGDTPLPLSVDRIEAWEAAKVGAWAEMAVEGVILESAADIEACFPEAAPNRRAARDMVPSTLAGTPIIDSLIGVPASVRSDGNEPGTGGADSLIDVHPSDTAGPRLATYKRLGRFAPARAILLPNGPADLKTWLFDRLGGIAWVRVEPLNAERKSAPPFAEAAE